MNKLISLWWLPVAIFKWTMFEAHFIRKQWDGSSYSYDVQMVGRIWSPTYWFRAIIVFISLYGSWSLTKKYLQTEINLMAAKPKSLFGYIPIHIRKPIRHLYFFVTLYIL